MLLITIIYCNILSIISCNKISLIKLLNSNISNISIDYRELSQFLHLRISINFQKINFHIFLYVILPVLEFSSQINDFKQRIRTFGSKDLFRGKRRSTRLVSDDECYADVTSLGMLRYIRSEKGSERT